MAANKIWNAAKDKCECNSQSYTDTDGSCVACPSGSIVNEKFDGCVCTGNNSEWMPMCNTCECIDSAYLSLEG